MPSGPPGKKVSVLRNTLILVGGQFLGIPLSVLINAVMGRYLGAVNFGYAYLATSVAMFGFLFVDWGHNGVLPAAVAQNRARAGALLGSSMVWKLGASLVVGALLSLGCWLLGYPPIFRIALAIVLVQWVFTSLGQTCQDVVTGFERTDVAAMGKLGIQLLAVFLVIPTLLLGGQLHAVLLAQCAGAGVMLVLVWRATRRAGVTHVTFRPNDVQELFQRGSSFLMFGFAMALQGIIGTVLLSKLAPAEVVGWHGAAQRLSGILVIPASALITALYPTLARLHLENPDGYRDTAKGALRGTTLLAMPLALCCALYRDIGVALFSKDAYGPAAQNLLVQSALLFLVYFSMPLGSAILAAGKQRQWAWAQTLCVVVALGLDPVLIPWFQRRYGNGGLGVSVAGVVSELLMVVAALFLTAPGVVDRSLAKALGRAVLAGAGMAGVAFLLRSITPYVAAPLAVTAYFGCLWLVGGLDRELVAAAWDTIQRKLKRRAAA